MGKKILKQYKEKVKNLYVLRGFSQFFGNNYASNLTASLIAFPISILLGQTPSAGE